MSFLFHQTLFHEVSMTFERRPGALLTNKSQYEAPQDVAMVP